MLMGEAEIFSTRKSIEMCLCIHMDISTEVRLTGYQVGEDI